MMGMGLHTLLIIPIFIISVVLHEVAHGWVALKFGDDTAKQAGRLTLNPLPHLDLLGSVILPAMLMFMGMPVFGWAKPVPVNSYKLHPNRQGEICVSLAGVAANFLIAILLSLFLRLRIVPIAPVGGVDLWFFALMAIQLNLLLGVFNLMPIPPLDGWRIWGTWLPHDLQMKIEMNAMLFMVLLFLLFPYLPILPLVRFLFFLLTGIR